MTRINEDIRFYLPADPYYYQVDNLPLKDLLDNDIALQEQIDNLSFDDTGAVFRNGIKELQPFIDAALPGQVSVRSGNFIGRTNRTNGTASERAAGSLGNAGAKRVDNGTTEIRTPPTTDGPGTLSNFGDYNVANPIPAAERNEPAQGMARTSVFNFHGGSISIDGFDHNEFATAITDDTYNTTAPLARLDLIGITTINGAMDDPFLWGNVDTQSPVVSVDGHPRLAVVKGAGIVQSSDSHKRDISVTNADKGRRYITIGTAAENLNEYGRDLDGNITLGPKFGTIPMPDDVVNVLFSKTEIDESMFDFAEKNLNGSFFLPLAYVYVPQTHVAGAPIPQNYLKDIRPLFRTAELTLAERQAVAASFQPSLSNPLVTEEHAKVLVDNAIEEYDSNQPPPPPPDPGHKWEFIGTYTVVDNQSAASQANFGRNGIPVYHTIPDYVFNGKTPVAVQFRVLINQQSDVDHSRVSLRMYGSSGGKTVARAGVDIKDGRPLSTDGCINTFLYPPTFTTGGQAQIGLEVTGTITSLMKISVYVDGFIY